VCYFLCPKDAISMRRVPLEQTRAGAVLAER